MKKIELLLNSLSEHPEVKNKNTPYCDKLFAKLKKDCNYCLNILLVDEKGNNIGSAVNPEDAHKLNYLDREWFVNGMKGIPYINSPHISKLFNEKTVMVTYPVFNQGRQVAVLGIPVNLSKISEEIKQKFIVSEKTNIAIVNDKGVLMFNLLYPEFVGGPIKTKAVNDFIFSGLKGYKEIIGYDNLERLYIFDTIEKINWKIFVSIPPTELYSEGFKKIKNEIYLAMVVFILSFSLSVIATRRFSKNTEILLSAFRDLREGKRDIIKFPNKTCYEFGEIFKAFNETTNSILVYEKEIERLNRFYKLLSEINQKIVRFSDINLLVKDICKDIVEIGTFDLALITNYQNNGKDFYVKVTGYYYSERIKDEFLKELNVCNLKSKVFLEIARDKELLVKEKCLLNEDEKGLDLITSYIPIFIGRELYGVMVIATKEKVTFNDNEIALFREMAGDLGFAIDAFWTKKEREKNENLLNNLFAYMGEGLIVIDKNKKILLTNQKYSQIVNKDIKNIIGQHCYECLFGFEKSCFELNKECMAEFVFRSGEGKTSVYELFDKDGVKRTYSVRYDPILEDNEIKYVIVILNDLTDYKKLEQQYFNSQKLESIGRLSAGIAHDFNNILTGILGSATLAKIRNTNSDIESYLDTIIELSDKAGNLTRSLLTFSRKQVSNPQVMNVNEAILKSEKILKRVIGENIAVKLNLTPKPLKIYIDPLQFEQIVMNLAVNAKDAISTKEGLFIISTELIEITEKFVKTHNYGKKGDYALITFSDNGCGIPKDIIDKIFDPFFTTKEAGKGTGLGLSVVYGIVKSFDGFINVYSEEGKGTTFKIYFPVYYENGDKIAKKDELFKPEKFNLSVLLVEDDKNVLEVLKGILENFGISVEVAENGLKALEILKYKDFDMVITDIVMPKLSGVELYNKVKEFNKKVNFIFVSGYPYDFIKENFLIDFNNLLTKPVTPEKLYNKIYDLIKDKTKV